MRFFQYRDGSHDLREAQIQYLSGVIQDCRSKLVETVNMPVTYKFQFDLYGEDHSGSDTYVLVCDFGNCVVRRASMLDFDYDVIVAGRRHGKSYIMNKALNESLKEKFNVEINKQPDIISGEDLYYALQNFIVEYVLSL